MNNLEDHRIIRVPSEEPVSSEVTPLSTEPIVVKRASVPLLGIGLAALLASATFFSGLYIGAESKMQASVGSLFAGAPVIEDSAADLTQFWKIWNLLDEKFAAPTSTEPVTVEEKVYGAIGGLVDSYGDPYTVFMPPQQAELFEADISGNFSGVGMEVGMRDDLITIITPLPGSPAEKAGVLPGDIIVEIDGTTIDHMSVDEAVRMIRGEKGTEVKITVLREGADELIDIAIIRDNISIPTSKTEMRGDVFIISLYSFNALSESEMQRALREYVDSGTRKLVLDLRGNPGGYLQSAVGIASWFLPLGKVVVRENFGDAQDEHLYRSYGKTLKNFAPEKMVVLVDGGSASASEILAGALKEHGVATVVGETTFGKGSVQELVELEDGSSLKVTIARWLTPNGTSISEGGLAPDIEVARTAEDRVNGTDPQLDKALELLAQ